MTRLAFFAAVISLAAVYSAKVVGTTQVLKKTTSMHHGEDGMLLAQTDVETLLLGKSKSKKDKLKSTKLKD